MVYFCILPEVKKVSNDDGICGDWIIWTRYPIIAFEWSHQWSFHDRDMWNVFFFLWLRIEPDTQKWIQLSVMFKDLIIVYRTSMQSFIFNNLEVRRYEI
jgi:hypothetical protein